jgi:hypothetical protein
MLSARCVVVRDDDDITPYEYLGILFAPFARAAGVRGRDQTLPGKPIRILLSLHNEDPRPRVVQEIAQAKESAPCASQIPNPPPSTIGPPLTKPLAGKATHLIQEAIALVSVVVRRFRIVPVDWNCNAQAFGDLP